jgi:urease accessory protein
MLRIFDPATTSPTTNASDAPPLRLRLSFDERTKSRARVVLEDGSEGALVLARGGVLCDGQTLLREDGRAVVVDAAPETLSSVETTDPLGLARAAYHLGNRHVALEIRPGRLRYQHDHVLDDMVRALGLSVTVVEAPFQPERGAYHAHHEPHGHHHHHHHG